MDDTEFHAAADATLVHCHDALDSAYASGALDELDLAGGILTIVTAAGKTFLLNKHAPSKQIWLASPISGGSHFSYTQTQWKLTDGTELYALLVRELKTHGVEVTL